jgi:hypothetical protein
MLIPKKEKRSRFPAPLVWAGFSYFVPARDP